MCVLCSAPSMRMQARLAGVISHGCVAAVARHDRDREAGIAVHGCWTGVACSSNTTLSAVVLCGVFVAAVLVVDVEPGHGRVVG